MNLLDSRSQIALALCLLVVCHTAQAQTTYRYKEKDGTVWFTDHKPRGVNFDRYKFIGYYGRPPATASCRGVNDRVMSTRAAAYADVIARESRRNGVSPLLVRAIISVESCFDRLARSVAGARGLMQLMPQTAKYLGVTDSYDPAQNIAGGVRYFREMQRRYNNNNRLALAAYNAGPGAVDRHDGVPPYAETQNYVRKVLRRFSEYVAAN